MNADDQYSGKLFDVIETPAGDIVTTGQTTHFRKGHLNAVIIRTTADDMLQ